MVPIIMSKLLEAKVTIIMKYPEKGKPIAINHIKKRCCNKERFSFWYDEEPILIKFIESEINLFLDDCVLTTNHLVKAV